MLEFTHGVPRSGPGIWGYCPTGPPGAWALGCPCSHAINENLSAMKRQHKLLLGFIAPQVWAFRAWQGQGHLLAQVLCCHKRNYGVTRVIFCLQLSSAVLESKLFCIALERSAGSLSLKPLLACWRNSVQLWHILNVYLSGSSCSLTVALLNDKSLYFNRKAESSAFSNCLWSYKVTSLWYSHPGFLETLCNSGAVC